MRHVELRTPEKDDRLVDEVLRETFPASDPPPWTSTHSGSPSPTPIVPETPAEIRRRLRKDIDVLAIDVKTLDSSEEHLTSRFLDAGRHVVHVPVGPGASRHHVEAITRGAEEGGEVIVVARHDPREPTGVAVLLSLAALLEGRRFEHSVRLVALVDGDSYAERLADGGIDVRAVIGLDTVGFCVERQDRRRSPLPLGFFVRPWSGEFVAVCGRGRSRILASQVAGAFRSTMELEARTPEISPLLPSAWSSSVFRPFWRAGLPVVMVTDAGPLRPAPRYVGLDLPDRLNYDHMAELVFGLTSAVSSLAQAA